MISSEAFSTVSVQIGGLPDPVDEPAEYVRADEVIE